MSQRKIEAVLKRKGITSERIEYERGIPTPSGYANGWTIEMSETIADKLFDNGFADCDCSNEFDTIRDVLEWIERMPVIKELT